MKTILGIDIETYSPVPLPKTGVYRYVDTDEFEILLFSYAYDDGPVQTVDMACGEQLPENVLTDLENPDVIKVAYNAQLERVCLSKYLGHWLDPHQWRCTAVMAAYLTMPARLADAAVALGATEQKMEEGKDLIRFFSVPCKPTKANDGRTRNLPEHAPDKWAVYKQYNAQDVETERAVRKACEVHPMPESEWELYALDQLINDRGVRVDKLLVKQAMRVDSEFTEAAYQRAKDITGLENPGSVAQLKAWLADQDVPMESLAKKLVQEKAANTEGLVSELLNLRLELSKTSIRKYESIARCVCRDGRVHGMLQFYGANRTGRWCLTGDHEVLTRNGWVRLDEWDGGYIACWNPTMEAASFQKAKQVSFPYEGKMYEYSDKRIHQISTPDHKMWFKRRYDDDSWQCGTVEEMSKCSRPVIPFTGLYRGNTAYPHVSGIELRIMVMVQADGFYTEDGSLRFHFTKRRKVERCKNLLRKSEIPHTSAENKDGTVTITVPSRVLPLWLKMFRSKTYGSWLLDVNADVFFDELPYRISIL